jgi:hypothetical protein
MRPFRCCGSCQNLIKSTGYCFFAAKCRIFESSENFQKRVDEGLKRCRMHTFAAETAGQIEAKWLI